MTKDRYLDMCEQLGRDPDPDKIPPDMNDFPDIVSEAIFVFNQLGDRIDGDVGYLGKDYSSLPIYMETITENRELFMEILSWLDSKMIKKSSEEMKRARDQAARKSKTGK